MIFAMISVMLVAMFWSENFYRLWIGEEYISGRQFHSVAFIFQILLAGILTVYLSNSAAQILVGANRVRTLATALICGSMSNLACSLVLIVPAGLRGMLR